VAKYEKYRNVLGQATTSDDITLGLWEEWEQRIVDLAQDEVHAFPFHLEHELIIDDRLQAVIEASVPSTTQKAATANRETKLQSRALRSLLESLDDVQRERADSVRRARQLADADDIQPRIAQEASHLARWTEVKPAMFEDTLEAELRKFEKFKRDVEDGAEAQDGMLRDLAVCERIGGRIEKAYD
jgi:programmed cell death 6-interacting protein